jgi:hypothetical protein
LIAPIVESAAAALAADWAAKALLTEKRPLVLLSPLPAVLFQPLAMFVLGHLFATPLLVT